MKDGCVQAAGSYKDIEAKHPKIINTWNSIVTRTYDREHIR